MRINEEIRAREVRVIANGGEQLGIMSSRDALKLALENHLDLVEIAPTAKPPVCRIMDYGKYRYEQQKREKEALFLRTDIVLADFAKAAQCFLLLFVQLSRHNYLNANQLI